MFAEVYAAKLPFLKVLQDLEVIDGERPWGGQE